MNQENNMNNGNIQNPSTGGQPQMPTNEQEPVVTQTPNVTQEPMMQTPVDQAPMDMQPSQPMPNGTPVQQYGQVPPVQPAPEKKSKTGLIIGIVIGAAVLIIAGILIFVLGKGGGGALSGPKGVVETYVNNLISKNYSENFTMVSIPENHFVEAKDYIDFVQNKDAYKNLEGYTVTSVEEFLADETTGMYNVILTNESQMIKNISVNLENKDGWKVTENNLFIKDWSIIVPKGTTVKIGEKEVPSTLLSADAPDANSDKYVIPAITSTKKTIVLTNTIGTKTLEETPLVANSDKKHEMLLENQDITTKAYNYIKDTWNQMYTSYISGENVSDVATKYFDSSVDINNVDVYYTQSFSKIVDNTDKNHTLLEVINGKKSNYILTNDLIQLNFGYKLSWIYDPTYSSTDRLRTMTRYSKIILKYDGTSFKIYDVQDERLFSYANYFTLDY